MCTYRQRPTTSPSRRGISSKLPAFLTVWGQLMAHYFPFRLHQGTRKLCSCEERAIMPSTAKPWWTHTWVWHHSVLLMNSFNKTEAAVCSCRLCFLRAFPFIIFNVLDLSVFLSNTNVAVTKLSNITYLMC